MLLWLIWGFALTFGEDESGLIGNLDWVVMVSNDLHGACYNTAPTISVKVFATFQMLFAAITPLLITGAFADRMPFKTTLLFMVLWETVVYYPVAHWIWGNGWLSNPKNNPSGIIVLDFAGGIVIHMTAGITSFLMGVFLGKRRNYAKHKGAFPYSDLTTAAIGVGLLFPGWYGFNGGSAFCAGALSSNALLNTSFGAAGSMLIWVGFSFFDNRHWEFPHMLNGLVAGLAGITPASGYVDNWAAWVIGMIVGLVSWFCIKLYRNVFGVDDSLDVSSVHGMTGMTGAFLIGFFGNRDINPSILPGLEGIFYSGSGYAIAYQLVGIAVVAGWTIVWVSIILLIFKLLPGHFLKISDENEKIGLDRMEHGLPPKDGSENAEGHSAVKEQNGISHNNSSPSTANLLTGVSRTNVMESDTKPEKKSEPPKSEQPKSEPPKQHESPKTETTESPKSESPKTESPPEDKRNSLQKTDEIEMTEKKRTII